jgi:hypothetical protein
VTLPVPATAEEVTPEWLTAALTESGVLQRGRVVAAPWERVGQEYGFTGVVGRVRPRYEDPDGEAPASLIVKLPMARDEHASGHRVLQERDPTLMRAYFDRCVREARFYREIPVDFAPTLYNAATDEERRRVVLVLEDVGGRQGDVLEGCSVDDAAVVIDELAPFHARWWGERAPVREFPQRSEGSWTRQERYDARVDGFLERFGDQLPEPVAVIVRLLRTRLANVRESLHGHAQTLIHADLHLDNLMFAPRGERNRVALLDWQTVCVGPPASDVTFFLFGSLNVEDRRAAEDDLLHRYLTRLDVAGYSMRELRRDFDLALLLSLAGIVGMLTTADPAALTARERAIHEAAFGDGRLVAALLDHEVAALL